MHLRFEKKNIRPKPISLAPAICRGLILFKDTCFVSQRIKYVALYMNSSEKISKMRFHEEKKKTWYFRNSVTRCDKESRLQIYGFSWCFWCCPTLYKRCFCRYVTCGPIRTTELKKGQFGVMQISRELKSLRCNFLWVYGRMRVKNDRMGVFYIVVTCQDQWDAWW